MSIIREWFPSAREDQLVMARNWVLILVDNWPEWNIPDTEVHILANLTHRASAALTAAKKEAIRTPAANTRCEEAFRELEDKMWDIKERYFLMPPLLYLDITALGLTFPYSSKTLSGDHVAQVTVETFVVGRRKLGVKIVYIKGSPGDPANKGYRIWYQAVLPGRAAAADPEQFTKSFFTRRKKDVIEFDFGDSGITVYIAARVENDEIKGTWGPLVSAVIP
jgi:hypothetical protein